MLRKPQCSGTGSGCSGRDERGGIIPIVIVIFIINQGRSEAEQGIGNRQHLFQLENYQSIAQVLPPNALTENI